jgi:acetyltransferase
MPARVLMSLYNLEKIFKAKSVAIIGASTKEGRIGHSLVKNLLQGGYEGRVYPVNPQYEKIQDFKTYASVLDIKKPVDLAIIAIPMAKVPLAVKDCVTAGIGGGIIVSAGGKEIGEKGRELEAEIKREAAKGNFRVIGPNCMGIVCAESKFNASFASRMPLPGTLAFISQSGAICGSILDYSREEGIGFAYFVSIGSMLDVDFGDLINYLGHDPEVSSIVLYMESLTNIRKFMSAARAVSRVKPIVVLKAGRSKAGASAAYSHTGAMAGEDAVYDAGFKRAGIVRVDTIEELFDCAELMAKQPLPMGPGVGILTNGGGPAVMAVDALSSYGIEPVALKAETIERLDALLPTYWSRGNPIDILGDASPARWSQALEVCISSGEINALIIIYVPQALTTGRAVAEAVVELLGKRDHPPVFAVWMGGENAGSGRHLLNQSAIPTYTTPERAVAAFQYMYTYRQNLKISLEIPPKLTRSLTFDQGSAKRIIQTAIDRGETFLTERESKALLKAYGIPVNRTEVAGSPDDAVSLAGQIGYPVAMKIHSRHIIHKSDAGGVKLNLRNEEDVRNAFDKIVTNARNYNPDAELEGVTVQPMLGHPDYELILGSRKDSCFGPVVLFGMGGIMTEILKDQAIALPPLNRLLANRLMKNTRVFQILKGYRNRPAANIEFLEETLIRISQLVTDFPEVEELDINPMVLVGNEACAIDARVIVGPSEVTSPNHLAICPYPNHLEEMIPVKGILNILIRPIKPEDALLMVDLFSVLTEKTVYYRFLSPMKRLSEKMLALFTQIDYDRDMALVALDQMGSEEKMLGVARLVSDPAGREAEFAVLVGDPWQGMGIGGALMERIIDVAEKRRIHSLWGIVLAENTTMLDLARKLGFSISRVADATYYRVEIVLDGRE